MIYEKNIFEKNYKQIDIHLALTYPNIYRTAMSSLGYNILYNTLNKRKDTWCERTIYPNIKSIESKTPLKYFDIISFSIQFEEDYFNVLNMLKQSEIPLKRKNRGNNYPLIIAGGPCPTANPKPLSDYIDLFIIGEGEYVLNELLDRFQKTKNKNLEIYKDITGIYIPEFDNETKIALVENMDTAFHITEPIISKSNNPSYQTVFNNTIMLNVSRGCTRGCRFCMAGYLYRPMRQTKCDKLIEIAIESREKTGINKITLIGAAVSDYSEINRLVSNLEKEGFQISTPSLRIESITEETLKTLKQSGQKTITIAPESISRLRKVLNKEISDKIIFKIIKNASDLDLNVKLYFLIGIPGENKKDIEALCKYMKQIADIYGNVKKVKFSINPLIPKPQTPLQWKKYDFKDIKNKTKYIKKEMKNYNIKCGSPKNGLIQYILSCGDENVGNTVEKSLTKTIPLKEWENLSPQYNIDSQLPWDKINVGITKEFLKIENKRLSNLKQTPWCEISSCYNCGACEKKNIN